MLPAARLTLPRSRTYDPGQMTLHNVFVQWALGYMAASGLIGLAVTYYFDDPANEKLNTILKVGLQLVGLVMIAFSSAAPEVSVGAAAALALSHVLHLPR